jgi:tetratricopeptide (TPR) repeat protein
MALALAFILQHYFKNKVLDAQFQSVLHLARLKNTEIASRSPDLAGSLSQPARALNEIRMARKAMLSRDWSKASTGLQEAVNLSSRVGDQRTVAVARLEQARCETMLDRYELALDLYTSVLKNNDASPKVADLAKLEILSLASLQGKREVGLQALLWRDPPEDDAISLIIDTLRGEMEPEKLMAVTFRMPPDMRNDAYFAAAIRYRLERSNQKAVKALNRCLRSSRPISEWPGPLARKVLGEWSG